MTNLVRRNVQIDYHTVKGNLPWGAVPSDVDGILEYNNEFLIIECKFPSAGEMSKGQFKLLQAFSRMENFTVVIIEIEEKSTGIAGMYSFLPQRWKFIRNGVMGEYSACTLTEFNAFALAWFKCAGMRPRN